MWRIVWFFCGACRVRITGGSPQWVLERLAGARVALRGVCRPDEFTLELTLLRRDAVRARAICAQAGCEMTLLRETGFRRRFAGLIGRPVLLGLLLLSMAGAFFLSKFVFFFRVEGNERVSAEQILQQLDELGVRPGVYGPDIRPQELKNRMLCRLPQLQWLTVQQSGMCATVVVRERPEREPVADRRTPQNVIAARAGVLTRVETQSGSCLCAPGQAVRRGELLVSAYTDFGFKTQVCAARAEIYANTLRTGTLVCPDTRLRKERTGRERRLVRLFAGHWSLRLGNADVSGWKYAEKQTERRAFTLPGGFSLPLGIEIIRICEYDIKEEALDAAEAQPLLEQAFSRWLQEDMVAGTVQSVRAAMKRSAGLYTLHTAACCEEMIARMVPAAIKEAGQNGTNH